MARKIGDNMIKMIYSDSLDEMVVSGFTKQKVYFNDKGYLICKPIHYTWNDEDCVYYNDVIDYNWYGSIPKNGTKIYTIKPYFDICRLLIKLDKC